MRIARGRRICAPSSTAGARSSASSSSGPAARPRAGAEALRGALAERVRELRADASADEAAWRRRSSAFADRSDITEEIVRFRGHLEHWRALSDGAEPCGRKLDFLLQEMNREVNTLGSKAEGLACRSRRRG